MKLLNSKQQASLLLVPEKDSSTLSVHVATPRNAFQRNAQGSQQTPHPTATYFEPYIFLPKLVFYKIIPSLSKLSDNEQSLVKKSDYYYILALGSEGTSLHSRRAASLCTGTGAQLFMSACHTYPRSTLSTATLVEEEMRTFHGLALSTVPESHFSNSSTKNRITTASK